jgi:hypothetical protein
LSIFQKTLGALSENGSLKPKRVGVTIHNYYTELIIVEFDGFIAYINKMHDSRNKIPNKNSSQGALRGGI